MLSTIDWAGISATITAFFAGVIGIVTLFKTNAVHNEVKNPNGSTTGQAVEDIHAAVSTPADSPTLGVAATETNAAIHKKGSL